MRSLTIDRARYTRLARELLLQSVSSPQGKGRLGAWTAVAVVVGLLFGWPQGLGVGVVAVLLQLTLWRVRLARQMRLGLGAGQSITVEYAVSGDLTINDVTGRIWLPRGSVLAVIRKRGIVTVWGREIVFSLPGELLTDADIAFLEGHGDVPEQPSAPGPTLPLSLEMSSAVQARLVADATRSLVTSADFLFPIVTAPVLLGAAAFMGTWPLIVTTLFCVGLVLLSLPGISRSRRSIRRLFPVDRTIRALATAEDLVLSTPHRTQRVAWSAYQAHRLTPHTVLLRRSRRHPLTTEVLPRALLPQAALTALTQAVPRRF